MERKCPNCGNEVREDFIYCPSCGAALEGEPTPEQMGGRNLFRSEKGKYSWIYEMPMGRAFFLLAEVWKVLGIAAAAVAVITSLIGLVSGSGLEGILHSVGMAALVLGILLVLSIPAYYVVTKANNGMYTVLFEMDDDGVDHTQIKTDKAKALDILITAVGAYHRNPTTAGAGLLSAGGGSLYSRFSRVKKLVADKKNHLIRVNGALIRNMVYADDENFDFIYDFIASRCPGAKKIVK